MAKGSKGCVLWQKSPDAANISRIHLHKTFPLACAKALAKAEGPAIHFKTLPAHQKRFGWKQTSTIF